MSFEITPEAFLGPNGSLTINPDDEVSAKLAMLVKGECGPGGPSHAAEEFGFSRQRYFQLRTLFYKRGAAALVSQRRGPKTNYRRTRQVVCEVVRYRFLDPELSGKVIAQKLRQSGFGISARSVERVLAEFGLQKKTLSAASRSSTPAAGNLPEREAEARRARRSGKPRTRRPPTAGR